jgi:hypothetical protein
MIETGLVVKLHWCAVDEDEDPRWAHDLALYAYLAPVRAAIYYIGKCDRTSVRGRWCYSAKPDVWDCIQRRSKTHRLIVAEIETDQRLTRELVSDIESLLIYRVHQIQPLCNRQNTTSRGKHCRPGMRVECRGAWPLSQKTFRDE